MSDARLLEALTAFKKATLDLNEAWQETENNSEKLLTGYPFHRSFDDLTYAVAEWHETNAALLTAPVPKHYAGAYGHDYYFVGETLVGQPSLASGEFTPNEDEATAVSEFAEPLTAAELADVLAHLKP